MHSHTGRALLTAVVGVLLLAGASSAAGQTPITYHLSFPALEHHEVQVEVDLPGLGVSIAAAIALHALCR